jgi:hypothetical protein
MVDMESSSNCWTPSSAQDKKTVLEELQAILASPMFRNSHRYPALLQYIVEKSLEGQSRSLKERIIGIEVFNRTPGYDTSSDPVVRFSAGEVRKRLAQYYATLPNSQIRIDLPVGSYVPEYLRLGEAIATDTAPESASSESGSAPGATEDAAKGDVSEKIVRFRFTVWFAIVAAVCIAVIASGLGIWHYRQMHSPEASFWAPILDVPGDIFICIGRTHPELDDYEPPDFSLKQHIWSSQFRVSMTSVDAVADVVGFARTHGKNYKLQEAYSTDLTELRSRPVVLLSANNNPWTLRLLQPYRYYFVSDGDLSYIADSLHPDNHSWLVDFSKPYMKQSEDYAIVARLNTTTTNGPVAVLAGIGPNGTESAGEFATSDAGLAQIDKVAPRDWRRKNFEIVLKVEVIGGKTGEAKIIASQFW